MEKKIGEVNRKIPDVSGLVTTTVLNTKVKEVNKKVSDLSSLVKKTDYDAKMSDIEKRYFTTSDYSKFRSDIVDAKIKQKELANKSDIANLVKMFYVNTKLTALATKAELKAEQDKIIKFKEFDSSDLHGKTLVLEIMVLRICLFINQHVIC